MLRTLKFVTELSKAHFISFTVKLWKYFEQMIKQLSASRLSFVISRRNGGRESERRSHGRPDEGEPATMTIFLFFFSFPLHLGEGNTIG